MEGLYGSLQSFLGSTLIGVVTVLCLIVVVIVGCYNWLYLTRIIRSNDRIGLRAPEHFCHLVRFGIFLPFATAIFTIVIIVTGFVR